MDDVLKHKQNKNHRLFLVCQRLLKCIRARVRMTMSCCKIRHTVYSFRTLNLHGCPMLSNKGKTKIKKYVTKKLKEEGFEIRDVPENVEGIEWAIIISW